MDELAEGVLRVTFRGRGGDGSEGNPDGERVKEATREALASGAPAGWVIKNPHWEPSSELADDASEMTIHILCGCFEVLHADRPPRGHSRRCFEPTSCAAGI